MKNAVLVALTRTAIGTRGGTQLSIDLTAYGSCRGAATSGPIRERKCARPTEGNPADHVIGEFLDGSASKTAIMLVRFIITLVLASIIAYQIVTYRGG